MTQLNTSITDVTVYTDRARITRRGTLKLETSTQSLEIAELPLALNPDSLRASARGSARARLLGAQVNRTFYTETPSERARQLEQEIEKLQDELKRLEDRAGLIKQSRAYLDTLASQGNIFATALAAREITVEAQLTIYDSLSKQAEKLDNDAQVMQTSRREKDRLLQKLTMELEQLRGSRPRERYSASVEIEVLAAGDLTIEISYMVSGARWKPLYDLRLFEKEDRPSLEVGYLAQVTQNTGENWEQVSLTLSTSRPALSYELPELDPWYIDQMQPSRPMARGDITPESLSYASMKAQPAPAAALAQVGMPAEEVVAVVEASGPSITYGIPGSITIPPDGAPHKVLVSRFPLTPDIDYVSAPKLAEVVYRRAKLLNESSYTFLPGDANIFIGEEYIGTTPLELTAPQGQFEINLGVEDRFKVEREMKRRDIDKRFVGGKKRFEFGYEIKLENLLPLKCSLTLQDQIPVARHEEIRVRLESIDPKPAEQSELNLLTWELTLEPKEKRTIRFDFSVESPQGMDVMGLP